MQAKQTTTHTYDILPPSKTVRLAMPPNKLAAVDLGSNSFHVHIARVSGRDLVLHDHHKETVRLGAGITPDLNFDLPAQTRALAALARFAPRLQGLPREAVHAVGTNAWRVASRADAFKREAEAALGYPIEVLSGHEEARLIYLGVAHHLPAANFNRLVVDVGGGSTEFIIGETLQPKLAESLALGCVTYTERFFSGGQVDAERFARAEAVAARELALITKPYRAQGWREAYGSSGTAKSIGSILSKNDVSKAGITQSGLQWLKREAINAGSIAHLKLAGVKGDRAAVLPGGLAILLAVFAALEIAHMHVADTALRDGVLVDLLDRTHPLDAMW